jgi:hypothetical protein
VTAPTARPAALPDDDEARAAAYLRDRLRVLDGKYSDRWPRWTNRDYIAVVALLRARDTRLQQEADGELERKAVAWDAIKRLAERYPTPGTAQLMECIGIVEEQLRAGLLRVPER